MNKNQSTEYTITVISTMTVILHILQKSFFTHKYLGVQIGQ